LFEGNVGGITLRGNVDSIDIARLCMALVVDTADRTGIAEGARLKINGVAMADVFGDLVGQRNLVKMVEMKPITMDLKGRSDDDIKASLVKIGFGA
jgi:hypothetical protein